MVEKLEFCGLKQNKLDTGLFIGDVVISVMCVDDILMWSTGDQNIIDLTKLLNTEVIDIE